MQHAIDYQLNKLPKCPHCATTLDVWEGDNPLNLDYQDGGFTTFECKTCFKDFVCVTHVEYRFSTAVSEEAASDEEWGPQDDTCYADEAGE